MRVAIFAFCASSLLLLGFILSLQLADCRKQVSRKSVKSKKISAPVLLRRDLIFISDKLSIVWENHHQNQNQHHHVPPSIHYDRHVREVTMWWCLSRRWFGEALKQQVLSFVKIHHQQQVDNNHKPTPAAAEAAKVWTHWSHSIKKEERSKLARKRQFAKLLSNASSTATSVIPYTTSGQHLKSVTPFGRKKQQAVRLIRIPVPLSHPLRPLPYLQPQLHLILIGNLNDNDNNNNTENNIDKDDDGIGWQHPCKMTARQEQQIKCKIGKFSMIWLPRLSPPTHLRTRVLSSSIHNVKWLRETILLPPTHMDTVKRQAGRQQHAAWPF